MNDQTPDFELDARNRLRARENTIDGASLKRLAAARAEALNAPVRRFLLPEARWLAGAVMAAIVGIAVLTGYQHWQTGGAAQPATNQLAENPELYRDLDFYMWLSESDLGTRG